MPESRQSASITLELCVVCVAALLVGFVALPSDPDLWFHLADGEYILAHDAVPRVDIFSFTKAGEPWTPHSWFFDVAVAVLWHMVGPRQAEAVFATFFMLAIVASFATLTRRDVPPPTAMAVCLALALACGNTRGLRPQVLSLLFCSVLVGMLDRLRSIRLHESDAGISGAASSTAAGATAASHRSRVYEAILILVGIAAMFLLWAQVHAACVMGELVIAVWLVGRVVDLIATRDADGWMEICLVAAALMLAAIAILPTPHAISHYEYVRQTMNIGFLRSQVAEWRPVAGFSIESPDIFLNLLTPAIALLAWRHWRKLSFASLLLAAGVLALAWTSRRHIPLACVACVPLLADALRGNALRTASRFSLQPRQLALTTIAGLATLAILWRFPTPIAERYRKAEPLNGAAALASLNRPLRVMTSYNNGAFVAWRAPDRLKVAVDSRADVFGDALLWRTRAAAQGRAGALLLDELRADAAVVERRAALAGLLRDSSDWRLLAEDADELTFVRESAE